MSKQGFRATCQLAFLACGVWCGTSVSAEAQLTRDWWKPSQRGCATCNWPHNSIAPRYSHPPQFTINNSAPTGCDCDSAGTASPSDDSQFLNFPAETVPWTIQPPTGAAPVPTGNQAAVAPLPPELTLIPPSPSARFVTNSVGTAPVPWVQSPYTPETLQPAPLVEPRIVRRPPTNTSPNSAFVLELPAITVLPDAAGSQPASPREMTGDSHVTELPTIQIPAPRTVSGPGIIPRTATRDEWQSVPARSTSRTTIQPAPQ